MAVHYEPYAEDADRYIVPYSLMRNYRKRHISISEVMAYSALKHEMDKAEARGKSKRDENGYYIIPNWRKIMSFIGTSETSSYYLKVRFNLLKHGLIEVDKKRIYLTDTEV